MFHRFYFKNQYNDAKNIPSQFFLSKDEAKHEIYNKLDSENIKAFTKLVSDNKSEIFKKVEKISKTFLKIKYFIREFDEIHRGYTELEKACFKYDNMVEYYHRTLENIPENWDPVWQRYSHDNSSTYHHTVQEFDQMKDRMRHPKVRGYESCDTLRDGEAVRRDRLNQLYLVLSTLVKDARDTVSLLEKSNEIIRSFPEQAYVVEKACEEIKEIALQFIQNKNMKDNDLSETQHFRRLCV